MVKNYYYLNTGKNARVRFAADNRRDLYSYETLVCVAIYNNGSWKFYRTWDEYSATTMKHVNIFRKRILGCDPITKKQWLGMPITKVQK